MAKVKISTTMGDITVRLYDETPQHRDNFVKLASEGFFNGTLFHRVIKDFMIQGGDPESKGAPAGKNLGSGGPGYNIPAEIQPALFHKRGALSAARLGDEVNPTKESSGSQFYIVWGKVYTKDELQAYKEYYKRRFGKELQLTPEQETAYTTVGGSPHLDGEYTVFGEVVNGLEVVENIQNVKCDENDRPIEDVRILKVEIIK